MHKHCWFSSSLRWHCKEPQPFRMPLAVWIVICFETATSIIQQSRYQIWQLLILSKEGSRFPRRYEGHTVARQHCLHHHLTFASNLIHPYTQPSWIHLWRDGQQSSLQACTLSSFLFFSPLLCVSFRVLTGLLIVEQRVCYDAEGATAIYLGYTWREEHINVYVDLTPFPLNADALPCYLQLWARTNAEQVSCSFFFIGDYIIVCWSSVSMKQSHVR